jgi:two-component system sensor histidine kinase TorS
MVRVLSGSELDAEQRRHLDMVASSGEALLGILNSVLDYSKIDLGKISADPSDFDPQLLLEGVVALMATTAREKGLTLALDVKSRLPDLIRADAGKLRQIVFNLVSNGVKFTERGGVTVRADLVGGNGMEYRLRIEVDDTGIGIPPEHRDRIFDAFTQLDASITRRFGGTGLGLAISRRLAEALGGGLTVRSEPGRGSCFTLDLPIELVAGTMPAHTAIGATRAGNASLDVLVVEDDEPTQIVAQAFLAQLGLRPRIATSGFDALGQARARRPDLVLMDLSLPGMDGIETMQRLREQEGCRDLPVIAMSAHVFQSDVDRTLEAGMSAFVSKPIDPERLEAAIATALEPASALVEPPVALHADPASLKADIAVLGSESVRELIALAESKIAERLQAIAAACGTGRRRDISQLAHAIASAAGSAGFIALNVEARAIEAAAPSEPPDVILGRVTRCEELLRQALHAARETLPGHGAAGQDAGTTVAANK